MQLLPIASCSLDTPDFAPRTRIHLVLDQAAVHVDVAVAAAAVFEDLGVRGVDGELCERARRVRARQVARVDCERRVDDLVSDICLVVLSSRTHSPPPLTSPLG